MRIEMDKDEWWTILAILERDIEKTTSKEDAVEMQRLYTLIKQQIHQQKIYSSECKVKWIK